MVGVEILTSAEVVTKYTFNWSVFGIILGVFFVVSILVSLWCYHDTNENAAFVFFGIFGIVLGIMLGCMIGDACKIPVAYETQYKVTISDEVSMTEFYEHYEVIEQDGKIFTVKEKTND